MYNTEKLVNEGAPALMHGIQNAQAKQVMEQHGEETKQQMLRLEQVFQMAGETSNDIQPDGIVGILKENQKIRSQGIIRRPWKRPPLTPPSGLSITRLPGAAPWSPTPSSSA